MCQRNGSGGPGNRALLSLRTGAVEAGRYGVHAACANVCGLLTMPAVALTMRIAHAAPLTTLCAAPPVATGYGWPSPLPLRSLVSDALSLQGSACQAGECGIVFAGTLHEAARGAARAARRVGQGNWPYTTGASGRLRTGESICARMHQSVMCSAPAEPRPSDL